MIGCRYAREVCEAIVAKCLTGRPKTVEKAQIAFLLWVELEACEVFLVNIKEVLLQALDLGMGCVTYVLSKFLVSSDSWHYKLPSDKNIGFIDVLVILHLNFSALIG